ncbi:Zn-dependent hydrolase [Paramyrothecium foliicola]|nr:Zn-dependent hydrolase [Paramyrothecium foliicola]
MAASGLRQTGHALATLRILEPHPGVFAYYDGRTGERFHSEKPNWLDDGAFTLGVATYAIVSGNEALLYDAAITDDHAMAMLNHVRGLGVTKTTVVYSHFHNDHIAGATALAGSGFVGHNQTFKILQDRKEALATADPPITAVLPTTLYETEMRITVGNRVVELHNFNVHTPDGTILFMPQEGLLFAGDTLEDTATYIDEPSDLSTHQAELRRMASLPILKILPAHGSFERIAAGGYDLSFIDATLRYIQAIDEQVPQPAAWTQQLSEVVAADLKEGHLEYLGQYESVHQANVQKIQELRRNLRKE